MTSPHQHSVLVVEDDPDVLNALVELLGGDGMAVWPASSAQQAIDTLEQATPCMAILDIMLPGMDGLSLCRTLKERPGLCDIPIAIITAKVSRDDVDCALEAGAVDYIKKPFDRDEVRLRIRSQIRLHEAMVDLRKVRQQLGVVSECARDAIIMVDSAGHVAHWNQAAVAMFGYSEQEAGGADLHALIAPERYLGDYQRAFAMFRRTGQGAAIGKTLELRARHRDGREFDVELSLSAARVDDGWCAVGFVRDITERRKVERELANAHKLEAVGQLAAGIAHEINTPTQYVNDNLQFLRDSFDGYQRLISAYQGAVNELERAGTHRPTVQEIRSIETETDLQYLIANIPESFHACFDGISRVATIVRAMKEFAHPDQREMVPADLNKALESTLVIARNEYKYVADIVTDLRPIPHVICHVGDLNQVFLNLVINAAHAIREAVKDTRARGKITVRTSKEDSHVRVAISDTGVGIPESIRLKVFDPFFTTKPVGIGSGQGLSIARSIVVDRHHGQLTFDSEVGVGTTFTIRLPIRSEPDVKETT